MFLFLFVFLVLFVSIFNIFHFRHLIVLFCVCVVWFFSFKNRTKWFCCLHLVVFFPFLLFCFEFCLFSFLSKKDPQKTDTAKTQKAKMQKKRTNQKNQLAQLCSQIVFLFLGVGLKMQIFAENTIKIVVSAYFEKWKRAKNVKKVESKLGPRLRQNLVQVCCAT